ncbi:LacI family DNA-binding transcriptional regulator [Pelagovum pacificum]|uniref:LacI family DNA-binding transcriptional regulator n=1 Tax=Pelagovum pacificum TaxID=2588711 RepID=A0A5C5GAL2_9RHOB|nr:substrate-binding domain-containing protein [Pelagovum pacificum]QQA41725.1 substrate-binding domain-containing protein [Pelagovum pacificum]TNY31000.1 LacI family DNA-binding transcriptional regulator [Pelagovum pacificum]
MKDRNVTALDVARHAGVSRSAVSRTFTDGASVSEETRAKVMSAAEELGYRVNFLARSLIRQRSELVALVVSDMDHSFRAILVDQLSRGLVARGYRPVLLPWTDGDEPRRLIDMMLHYNVAGAIVTSDTPPVEIADESARWGVPLVLVNKAPVHERAARVMQDTDAAGLLAAEALYEAGCRRVAYAGQRRRSFTIDARRLAFERRLAELGMSLAGSVAGAAQNHAGGMEAGEAFLASGLSVDGVHCANDFIALGFIDRLRQAGITAPEDVKLVGCDDIAEAAWPAYDLTTIRQDVDALAQAALKALAGRIEAPQTPADLSLLGVGLVRRGSTGVPS